MRERCPALGELRLADAKHGKASSAASGRVWERRKGEEPPPALCSRAAAEVTGERGAGFAGRGVSNEP